MNMNKHRKHRAFGLLASLSVALVATLPISAQAQSQDYPNKPVKLIVPYPPGGATDIGARVVAQKLTEQTGQAFVVENRPGAGGNLGAEAAARSPADGYTLLVGTTAHAINPSMFSKLNYDILKDFIPVSGLSGGPLVVVVNPNLPVKNVADMVNLAKTKQGGLNYASSGNGQSTHLAVELFKVQAKVNMTHVPYKGSAPALNDVAAGQADVMFDTTISAMPLVRAGKLRALAVTGATRSPAAPELPTIAESGYPGYEAIAWNGIFVPAGTPKDVVNKLNAELKKALDNPEVKQRFEAQGFASSWSSPEAFNKFVNNEVQKWANVAKVSGAKID